MCIISPKHRAFYAKFSYRARKPLKLNLKSEKVQTDTGRKAPFLPKNGAFCLLEAFRTACIENYFPTLIVFIRPAAIGRKKMNNLRYCLIEKKSNTAIM